MLTNLSIHINNRFAYGLGLGAVGVGPNGKNCSLDNDSLLAISQNFGLLKHLVIDMLSEINVTDLNISSISRNCKSIETLEISNNRNISFEAINGLYYLPKLVLKFYFEAIGTAFITRTLIKGNSIRVKN
jgi:hypothetical protein